MTPELKARFDQEIVAPHRPLHEGQRALPALRLLRRGAADPPALGPVHTRGRAGRPDVRDGIKEYSSWPTIPQVYIHGKFVGGSDIIRELEERGELKALIDSTPGRPRARERERREPRRGGAGR